ncbi:MAG: hypothetical protein AAF573_04505, partial [Bacteroidota bacterium]
LQAYRVAEDAYHKITLSKDSLNFPLATYWLGSVKKSLGKYDEALQVFNTYLEKFKRVNVRFSKRAEKDIVDCEWAAKAMRSNLANVKVNPLKKGVNTPYSEFGAIEVDGEVYFSSMRYENENQQLYSKLMRLNKNGEVESFDFNTKKTFAANPALSFDGKKLYYTNCKYDRAGNIKCEIVYRERNYYGDWGAEQSLPTFINFPGFTATHPTIGYDKINKREILFFVSNRPGGKGKLDIWYSTIAPNGKMTRPVNHTLLNTRENDVTPFFHSPSQTLYYSSDGYPGMGGYDIYKSKRAGRSWQTPIHLTYPINSSYNDFYFSLNKKGTQSYFSSNREEALELDPSKEACCNDIFTAALTPDRVELTDEEFVALNKPKETTGFVDANGDAPKVILKSYPENSANDEPETVLGGGNNSTNADNPTEPTSTVTTATNEPQSGNPSEGSRATTITDMNSKGEETSISNTTNANSTAGNVADENLPLDIFSLVFQVEVLDMELQPLKGVTVKFIEKSNEVDARNFTKINERGNLFKFRIKDHVDYQIVFSKQGFVSDTFSIDKEVLLGATELPPQPFFMSPSKDENLFPTSPVEEVLAEEIVTEAMLSSFLPTRLHFNDDEPDPNSWSNTTNRNYEQTFLQYYSKKDRFKSQYARRFAASQRDAVLKEVDDFFEKELKNGYQDLAEFSERLLKYLEQGNKVTIGLQAFTTPRAAGTEKNKALLARRMDCVKNHFQSFFGGKLIPYVDAGVLEFKTLDPMIISSKNNGLYSPEASKLRRIEIKTLEFNNF